MDEQELVERFWMDEQSDGAAAALRYIDAERSGRAELNVWILEFDVAQDTLHLFHDFDPYEGDMALSHFIGGLQARLAP
jgi:REP element-mobilizing transposase RayT